MTSISRQEESRITIRFLLERDPDNAASDVRDRAGRVRGRLPDEIDEPIIQKTEADAQSTLYISMFSDRYSQLEISDFADRYVKEALQTVPGVAEVRIFGERRYSMRIWLDPERMAAYGLTTQDVETALRAQNRSEEHTSELQSLMRISYAVFCLKKKNNIVKIHIMKQITI